MEIRAYCDMGRAAEMMAGKVQFKDLDIVPRSDWDLGPGKTAAGKGGPKHFMTFPKAMLPPGGW